MRKNALMLVLWLILAGVCTGCGDRPERKEEINIAIGSSPQTIDPQLASDTSSDYVIAFMIENLFRYNEEMELVPALVKDYDCSEDGLTYTFYLKEDLKWSDGSPLEAEDFVCSFQRLADPDVGSQSVFLITDACLVKNAREVSRGELPVSMLGVEAIDQTTLVVELEKPCPYFFSILAKSCFSPCDCDFYHKAGEDYGKGVETILSCGPYILDRYEPLASQIHFTKNPNYYEADKITPPGITLQLVANQQQSLMCFNTGSLDVARVSGDFMELAQGDERLKVFPLAMLSYMLMNQSDNPALKNLNIRKALSKSIDRESIVENVLRVGYFPMTRVVPNGFYKESNGKDFSEDDSVFDALCGYDPEGARECWKKGLAELGISSLKLTLVYVNGESRVMEALSAELEENLPGLTIDKTPVVFKELMVREKAGNYDMLSLGWVADYADPTGFLNQFLTSAHPKGCVDPEYDALYEKTRDTEYTQNPEKRDALLHQLEEHLIENMGIIPFYSSGQSCLVSSSVKGYVQTSVGGTCIVPALSKEVKQ